MVKKIKSTQSPQHKFSNRRIINTLQERLSIPWNTGRAIPDGKSFSSNLTLLGVIRLWGRKNFSSALLGFLIGSKN